MKKIIALMAFSAIFFTACDSDKKGDKEDDKMTNNAEAQEEKNKATALASVNALIAGDLDAVVKDGPSDGNVTDYGDGSMRPIKGVDSIKANLKMWRESLSEFKGENLWAVADGEYVAVFGDWSGTYKTDFMGMPTNGKSFKFKDADIFKFDKDGKIIEHRNVQSSATIMAQMGITMPK